MREIPVREITTEVYKRFDGIVPMAANQVSLTAIVLAVVEVLEDRGFLELERPE